MSEFSIEGLRQAFLDPGSRIRLNPKEGKLEPEEHAELVALAWEGGFLDGAAVHFNPNLNVLVGRQTVRGRRRRSGAGSLVGCSDERQRPPEAPLLWRSDPGQPLLSFASFRPRATQRAAKAA
jgi:hypothetical protein